MQSRIRRYLRHGTLPQLAVFEASARHSSLTRAAAELHLAQPTVSAQIRKLSETIGAPLFETAGRNLRLTEAGQRTYAHCQELFAIFGRMDDALLELRDASARELRLAVPSAGGRLAARMVAAFARQHPEVSASIGIANRAQLLERMARHDDDLYLFASLPDDAPAVRQSVIANPLVIIAARGDPLCRQRAVPLTRVAECPFVMREHGSGTRAAVVDLLSRAGLAPRIALELASDDAVRCAVAEGAGLGVVSRDNFARSEPATAILDVAGFPLPRTWHFAYPLGVAPCPAATAFLRHVRDCVAP